MRVLYTMLNLCHMTVSEIISNCILDHYLIIMNLLAEASGFSSNSNHNAVIPQSPKPHCSSPTSYSRFGAFNYILQLLILYTESGSENESEFRIMGQG